MTEFSAIYYPYATIDDLALLKRAIFTFDKLYLIYPTIERDSYKGFRSSRGAEESSPGLVDDGTRDLVNSGFVEIIEPAKTVQKFYDLMIQCYNDDLNDSDFLRLGGNKFWYLYREKVPGTILDHLPGFNDKYRGDEIRMPLAHGASIMISHAVFDSIEKNLTPITNDPESQSFLDRRLQRGLQFLNSPTYMRYAGVEERNRLNHLMAIQDKVINMVIPDASRLVSEMSLGGILNFRDTNKDLLRRYRQGMAEMAVYAQEHTPDPKFEDELVRMIENRIQPVYEELRLIGKGLPTFAVHRIRPIVSSTAIGASSITVIGGKPISSAAITSRETAVSHEVALDLLKNKHALTSHNLNYLLHG